MKFTIDRDIASRFPDLRIGILVAEDITNIGTSLELEELKKKMGQQLRESHSLGSLELHPHILTWRRVYTKLGLNPRRKKPTAENLLTQLLKGREIPTISKAVDSYLVTEAEFLLPVGGYDLNKLAGNMLLRTSKGGDPFLPIGSSKTEMTNPGEVVYSDDVRVLTRMWNYRDCDEAKITEQSQNIILMTEAPDFAVSTESLIGLLEKLKDRLITFCGGRSRYLVAHASQRDNYVI